MTFLIVLLNISPKKNLLNIYLKFIIFDKLYFFILIVYGKPRVCTFDGFNYCYECHENDEALIPARLVHNWDFQKHKGTTHILTFYF